MNDTYYVIRKKGTHKYLPDPPGRGKTWVEPIVGQPPRLFCSERAAKVALTWWLKGITTVARGRDYDGEYDETWTTEPEPHRKAEDMEVVPITLVIP